MAVEKDRLAECTFTPRLKAKPKPGGSGRGSGGRGSVGGRRGGGSGGSGAPRGVDAQQAAGERLHHDAEVRAPGGARSPLSLPRIYPAPTPHPPRISQVRTELRERRALSSEAWEAASFPFAPHINERPAGAALPTRPLHERLEDEVAKREAKLAQLRQKHAESEATFQPHIDPNSAAISLAAAQPLLPADARGGGGVGGASAGLLGSGVGRGDIVERLTAEGAVSLERRAAREAGSARARARPPGLPLTLA